jgi:phosphoribosylformylglycinamidine synthase
MSEKDFLFDDRNPAILVSVDGNQEDKFVDYMFNNGVRLTLLGHVTKGEMRLDDLSFGFINSFIE